MFKCGGGVFTYLFFVGGGDVFEPKRYTILDVTGLSLVVSDAVEARSLSLNPQAVGRGLNTLSHNSHANS